MGLGVAPDVWPPRVPNGPSSTLEDASIMNETWSVGALKWILLWGQVTPLVTVIERTPHLDQPPQ